MAYQDDEKAKAIDIVLWGRKGVESHPEPFSIRKLMGFLLALKSGELGEEKNHDVCGKILEDTEP